MCVIDGIKKCVAMNRWSYPLKSLELFFGDFMSDGATGTKRKYLLQLLLRLIIRYVILLGIISSISIGCASHQTKGWMPND